MTDQKKPEDNQQESSYSVFKNPAYRYAMGVLGLGWAMVGVAFYLAANQDDKAPPPPPAPVEQSVPAEQPKPPAL
ncbi:MAG: hypothetical protein KKA05_05235 [Alphaproteobacteria bacterium]|nr:hypothetical protein [Alphaproteobacteria bacterium]MBU0858513.1 hypothetical protein [Alphaproteobacteria bacterium]